VRPQNRGLGGGLTGCRTEEVNDAGRVSPTSFVAVRGHRSGPGSSPAASTRRLNEATAACCQAAPSTGSAIAAARSNCHVVLCRPRRRPCVSPAAPAAPICVPAPAAASYHPETPRSPSEPAPPAAVLPPGAVSSVALAPAYRQRRADNEGRPDTARLQTGAASPSQAGRHLRVVCPAGQTTRSCPKSTSKSPLEQWPGRDRIIIPVQLRLVPGWQTVRVALRVGVSDQRASSQKASDACRLLSDNPKPT